MKALVKEFLADISTQPESYTALGNTQFNGIGNDTYKLYHAGNNYIIRGVCSIISLEVLGTSIELEFAEKRKLERINVGWWDNASTEQMGIKK